MNHSLFRGIYWGPNDGGGGGGGEFLLGNPNELDDLLGLTGGDNGGTPAGTPPPANPLQLTDEQLDGLADRVVQRMQPAGQPTGQPTGQPAGQPAGNPSNPFEGNEFLTGMMNVMRESILQEFGGVFADSGVRDLGKLNMPQEVLAEVNSRLSKMPGAEVLEMRKNGGIEVLAKALYFDMLQEGKIAPPNPNVGNAGDWGDGGRASNLSPQVQEFVETFKGMHGRMPDKADAARWGVKL